MWNKLYKKTCIGNVLFEVGKINEDEFWTYQVFGKARKIAKISNTLYFYYLRPGSIMQTTYNLRRLDALEARVRRVQFVNEFHPALIPLAKRNLIGTCIYMGQMSLKYLDGIDKKTAVNRLNTVVNRYTLTKSDYTGSNSREKVWLKLSQFSFWGTVRLKNLLRKGF